MEIHYTVSWKYLHIATESHVLDMEKSSSLIIPLVKSFPSLSQVNVDFTSLAKRGYVSAGIGLSVC